MKKLEKYKRNVYTGFIFLVSAPVFTFLTLVLLMNLAEMNTGEELAGLVVAFSAQGTFLLALTFILPAVGLIIIVINIIKYFRLKKRLINEDSFNSAELSKKYIIQKIILFVSVITPLVYIIFALNLL